MLIVLFSDINKLILLSQETYQHLIRTFLVSIPMCDTLIESFSVVYTQLF